MTRTLAVLLVLSELPFTMSAPVFNACAGEVMQVELSGRVVVLSESLQFREVAGSAVGQTTGRRYTFKGYGYELVTDAVTMLDDGPVDFTAHIEEQINLGPGGRIRDMVGNFTFKCRKPAPSV